MDAKAMPVFQFLEGSGKCFIIPVYQRDYAWTKINCQKLWDDLVELNNKNRKDHFLGAIVTIGSGFEVYTIIDGQQRITTVSLLLIALHSYLKNKESKSKDEEVLMEQVLEFLINRYSAENDKRIRLKPNKQDKEHFDKLFMNGDIDNLDSNIINNYKYLYEKINLKFLSPRQIFDSFRKLKMVLIHLVREQDDPQLIFESLNSTGVKLKADDLIRNYILMDLPPDEQRRLYNDYWMKIEELTADVAEFVRNYLIYKLKSWVKKDDIYTMFKIFAIDNFYKNNEGILKDLLYFAKIYSMLVQISPHSDNEINNQLARLNKLEFTVSHPYFIDLFNDFSLDIISSEVVRNVLLIIESYAFRKILVDNTTQGLNKMFITLSRDIKKEETWKEQYLDILSYILLEKRVSQRFPNDVEFENALINKEVYRLQAKNRNFLLESLENYNSAYSVCVDELTVEHIMPRTLSKEWKNNLGDKWQDIHKKYLHTLGNLSLTAKNSELSNYSFEEKQQIDFQTSKLKLNYELKDLTEWNEDKIVNRAKSLIKDAKIIWAFPQTKYTKSFPDEQLFDLTSEDSFSGSKPSRLYLNGDQRGIELKSWRDMLSNVCKFIHDYSPTQFSEIQNSQELKWYFDTDRPLRNSLEFSPSKFVECGISANTIISFLKKLCDRINYPAENISFSLKNIKE